MNSKLIVISLLFLFPGISAEAQLLEKLKQRAEEKGLETKDVSFDTTDNAKNRTTSFEEEELVINSAKDFFTADIVMKMLYDTGEVIQTAYFDADVVAMRTELSNPALKPMFHDSKGYMYGYNEGERVYEKIKLLSSGMMGFMTAGMIPTHYKLPSEPYFEAFQKLEEKEITLNFLILELAFIYKPSHFENDTYYTPTKTTCNNSTNCIKFSYNDAEYPGSYILFDEQGRLSELYINTINPEVKKEEHPTGKFVYSYTNVNVQLPDAVELKTNPLEDIIDLNKGLEAWKYNKKDKEKN